ncbi:MAG: hypothetical protein R2856_15885 [Caldilineaceae bacterium]
MRLGAIVLAATFPAEDSPTQREKRVNPGSAGTATVALIHKLLLLSAGARDRVWTRRWPVAPLPAITFNRAAALAARARNIPR